MKVKIIKASPETHGKIQDTTALLQREFLDRAEALGITVKRGKKYRNLPGMKEALDCLISHTPISEYVGGLIQKYHDPMWQEAEKVAKGAVSCQN